MLKRGLGIGGNRFRLGGSQLGLCRCDIVCRRRILRRGGIHQQGQQYAGGKDAEGVYYTSKRWYVLKGLGFGWAPLLDDPEVIESTAAWGDIDLIRAESALVKGRQVLQTSWYPEWEQFFWSQLQDALLQKTPARDALQALRRRFPGDPRARTAAFLLGRIALDLEHDPAGARAWFSTYLSEAPAGPLAGDARRRLDELDRQ